MHCASCGVPPLALDCRGIWSRIHKTTLVIVVKRVGADVISPMTAGLVKGCHCSFRLHDPARMIRWGSRDLFTADSALTKHTAFPHLDRRTARQTPSEFGELLLLSRWRIPLVHVWMHLACASITDARIGPTATLGWYASTSDHSPSTHSEFIPQWFDRSPAMHQPWIEPALAEGMVAVLLSVRRSVPDHTHSDPSC